MASFNEAYKKAVGSNSAPKNQLLKNLLSDRAWLGEVDKVLNQMEEDDQMEAAINVHQSGTKPRTHMGLKAVTTQFAGPLPASLLARQDLEGSELEEPGAIDAVKSSITTISNVLERLLGVAEKADTQTQKYEIVSKITNVQRKQQDATLAARGKSTVKSFKDGWKEIQNEGK